ncbi:MAG: endonuclease MutS2 [Clostridia bacterium]|nr:endonuclease MutS2 [Clostridia bacterium]
MNYSFEKWQKTLELNTVLQSLAENALSPKSKEMAIKLCPSNDFETVKKRLKETEEAYILMSRFSVPSFFANENIPNILERSKIEATLGIKELLYVCDLLRVIRKAKDWRNENDAAKKLLIDSYFELLYPNKYLEDSINSVIKSEEEIYDKASSALYDIRRKKSACSVKVKDILDKIVRGPSAKYLQEAIVTQRDGRYVVPVKVEHRAQIGGIVHDTSSTGSTVFIEPMSVVEANNEMRVLEIKELEEITRILTELSAQVSQVSDTLKKSFESIIALDLIFAKARYAYKTGATVPKLNREGNIFLKRARHPLIAQKKVVPVTVGLGKDYDTLIITGPNTGGKTVTLKTIGLFCLMAMCGLMIPSDDGSEIAVFKKIFADIGDEQSIEQSLSTFSSHMVNIVNILQNADSESLVLFDELCAGTDPIEGAAIAKAVLMDLSEKGAKTVVTSHYPELKTYAIESYRVENAACEFDVETLKPTYRLIVGIPGSSNAFDISKKLGLGENIIETARGQLSEENLRFEKLAEKLEASRKQAEEDRLAATRLKSEIEASKKRYDNIEHELNVAKKKIVEESRQKANIIVNEARNRSAAILNELEELKKGFNAKNSAENLQKARNLYKKGIKELEENADPIEQNSSGEKLKGPPKIGDTVIVGSINRDAAVVDVDEKNSRAQVSSGFLKMWVPFDDLSLKKNAKPSPTKTRNITGIRSNAERQIKGEIDLRGMSSDEAIMELDRYIDGAVLTGITSITIIHGKGTGVLRKAVQSYLKDHKNIKSYRLGVFGEGENGVTVAEIQ